MKGFTRPQMVALDTGGGFTSLGAIAARTGQTSQGAAMTLASLVRRGTVEQIRRPARYRRADR